MLSKHRREYADDATPEFVREATRAGVAARLVERFRAMHPVHCTPCIAPSAFYAVHCTLPFPSAAVQAVRWSRKGTVFG